MEGPRPARPGEFAELMRFIDMVFRPGQKGRCILQRQYPHLYRNEKSHLARHLLMRDRGEIVGNLAIHPVPLRLEDVVLNAGGIGVVSAHPERRGEGIMSRLLEAAIERMKRKGYVLSVLGGDRQRYGWFGWENGGVCNRFWITPRYAGKPSTAERKLKLEKLRVSPAIARELVAIDRCRPYGVERKPKEVKALFERSSRDVWGCRSGDRFAYVVLGGPAHGARPYQRIDEIGGDPALISGTIRVLMDRYGIERLVGICGPNRGDIEILRALAGGWERGNDCMIDILDLPGMVGRLEPLLARRARETSVRGVFKLKMADSGQEAELKLGRGGSSHVVELGDRDMVSLFFGVLPVAEQFAASRGSGLLGRILPLPLHMPPLNHI